MAEELAQTPCSCPDSSRNQRLFGNHFYCTVALPRTAALTPLGDIYIYTYVHTLPTPTAETTPTVLERTVKM